MANIAILGYGTVGSGVFAVVTNNQDVVARKAGQAVNIKKVLDLRDFPGDPVEPYLTHRFEDILEDEGIDVVVEVMSGINPAYSFSKRALEAGKSVVTSNKAVVAQHGDELIDTARAHGVSYLFEASVGGAIPIIRPLMTSLTADHITEVWGILNGTTNYILTEMAEKGAAFADVLKEAQKLGYAEADPTADVEGHDACRKIAILSSLAYGKTVDFQQIPTEGITKITAEDIAYGKEMGCAIKLLGTSKKTAHGISAMVAPYFLPLSHPLASVNGVFNAIFVKGDMSGETMYYGSGAGKLTTASAVTADIIDAIRQKSVFLDWDTSAQLQVEAKDEVPAKAFVRVAFSHKDTAKKTCNDLFAVVKFVELDAFGDEFGLVVDALTEAQLAEKAALLAQAPGIDQVRNIIRMEE